MKKQSKSGSQQQKRKKQATRKPQTVSCPIIAESSPGAAKRIAEAMRNGARPDIRILDQNGTEYGRLDTSCCICGQAETDTSITIIMVSPTDGSEDYQHYCFVHGTAMVKECDRLGIPGGAVI